MFTVDSIQRQATVIVTIPSSKPEGCFRNPSVPGIAALETELYSLECVGAVIIPGQLSLGFSLLTSWLAEACLESLTVSGAEATRRVALYPLLPPR